MKSSREVLTSGPRWPQIVWIQILAVINASCFFFLTFHFVEEPHKLHIFIHIHAVNSQGRNSPCILKPECVLSVATRPECATHQHLSSSTLRFFHLFTPSPEDKYHHACLQRRNLLLVLWISGNHTYKTLSSKRLLPPSPLLWEAVIISFVTFYFYNACYYE